MNTHATDGCGQAIQVVRLRRVRKVLDSVASWPPKPKRRRRAPPGPSGDRNPPGPPAPPHTAARPHPAPPARPPTPSTCGKGQPQPRGPDQHSSVARSCGPLPERCRAPTGTASTTCRSRNPNQRVQDQPGSHKTPLATHPATPARETARQTVSAGPFSQVAGAGFEPATSGL